MSQPFAATPLQTHTLDTLLDELVSGRAVTLNEGGETFQLNSTEARSVFAWYRDHRDKWARSSSMDDIEAIVAQLIVAPPELPASAAANGAGTKRTLFLKSVRAHRFGGVHRFGTTDEAPNDFCVTFEKPLTLIEGANGAGKTSFLSTILWGLTGYVYCPLRPPERANQAVRVTHGLGADGRGRHCITARHVAHHSDAARRCAHDLGGRPAALGHLGRADFCR